MKTLNTTCGIYDTEFTLTEHKDGSITVRYPYIKWVNNNGSLAFKKQRFVAVKLVSAIRDAFENGEHELTGYNWGLYQACDGVLGE